MESTATQQGVTVGNNPIIARWFRRHKSKFPVQVQFPGIEASVYLGISGQTWQVSSHSGQVNFPRKFLSRNSSSGFSAC